MSESNKTGKRKTPEELEAWNDRVIAEILKFKPNPPPAPPLRKIPLEKKSNDNKKSSE